MKLQKFKYKIYQNQCKDVIQLYDLTVKMHTNINYCAKNVLLPPGWCTVL
jgi:hypothetical protein